MNQELEFLQNIFGGNADVPVNPVAFFIKLLITALLALCLSLMYERFGNALSNRRSLGKTLILVSLTTMLIISIVKSSLALSLGLVGALSIVRFRTAIKEPEELAYFFMSIAIGLGIGAEQILATVLGAVGLFLVIFFINRREDSAVFQNLILQFSSEKTIADFEKIIEILNPHCHKIELRRMDEAHQNTEAAFSVSFKSFNDLLKAKENLKSVFPDLKFNFLEMR